MMLCNTGEFRMFRFSQPNMWTISWQELRRFIEQRVNFLRPDSGGILQDAGPMPAMLKRSNSSRSSVQLNQLRNCARCALFGLWGNTMQRSQMWPDVCFALLTSSGRFDRLPFPAPICLSRQCPLILQALQQGTCLWFYSSVFQF